MGPSTATAPSPGAIVYNEDCGLIASLYAAHTTLPRPLVAHSAFLGCRSCDAPNPLAECICGVLEEAAPREARPPVPEGRLSAFRRRAL
jgi:hypothetical protein